VWFARGVGDGSFASATDLGSGGGDPIALLLAPLRAPAGRLDVAVAGGFASKMFVLLNPSQGSWTSFGYGVMAPTSLDAGDLDGDGDLDLVVADSIDGLVVVLENDGAGHFSAASRQPAALQATLAAVKLVDLDGDHRLDLVVALTTGDAVGSALGDGAGGFGAWSMVTVHQPALLAIADFDGDQRPDVAATMPTDSSVGVLRNQGGGALAGPVIVPIDPAHMFGSADLVAADLDGDGLADLASVLSGIDRLAVIINLSPR
jgi:hypothetical protein